jgi:putative transposase
MPRTARIAPGGMIFHVLNRGNARMRIFDGAGDYAALLKVMALTLEAVPMRLLAFCLMPNHWHLVLWPRNDGDLGRFMQRLTVTHVRRWHEHRHSTGGGHLYQGTYKSFPVQDDEHYLAVCRYIERNPLRAGLVTRAEEWRWSSLPLRFMPESSPLLSDGPLELPPDWKRRVNRPQTAVEEEAIRQSIQRGRPFGCVPWQDRIAKRLQLQSTFQPRGRPRAAAE